MITTVMMSEMKPYGEVHFDHPKTNNPVQLPNVRARTLAVPVHHTTVGLPCNYAAACSRPPKGAYIYAQVATYWLGGFPDTILRIEW